MSLIRNVEIGNQPLDAFGRMVSANPHTLFDSKFQYDLQPLIWEQGSSGGGSIAHVPARVCAELTVDTTNGATAWVQSYQHHPYQPGKAQQIALSFRFGAAVANVRRRIGYFTTNNGVFLEQDGTNGVYLVVRSNVSGAPVDTRVEQANWNADTLLGTGASGVTLDLSKTQIFQVDAQWLGVGRVCFLFNVDGKGYLVHESLHANLLEKVYCRTFSLPVRYEITNTAASAGAAMDAICSSVISSGGVSEDPGYGFTAHNEVVRSVGTTGLPLIAIRPRLLFNSIENRIVFSLGEVIATSDGNQLAYFDVVYAPATLVGGAWADVDAANSGMEANRTLTSFTGGVIIDSFFIANSSTSKATMVRAANTRLPMGLNASGAAPIGAIVIVGYTVSTTANMMAAFHWREIR